MLKVKKTEINFYPLYEELPNEIKRILNVIYNDIYELPEDNKNLDLINHLGNIKTTDLIKNINLDFNNRDPEKLDIIRNELIKRGDIKNMDYLTKDKFYYIIQDYHYKMFLINNKF